MNKSVFDDIIFELRKHSEGTSNADNHLILADYVWMLKHGGLLTSTEPIWLGIAKQLERVNVELKQMLPDAGLPRQMAYAVNGLMAQCLDYATYEANDPVVRHLFLELGWRISCGWDAVLAGDIDEVLEHVETEKLSRLVTD